jgi:hypothetical protein
MEDFIAIFMASIASILAIIAAILSKMVSTKRNKVLEVKDADGKTEEVMVPASSSHAEVQKLVLDAKYFEKHVGDILRQTIAISGNSFSLVSPKSGGPDFIVPELGLGFEVKTRISNRMTNTLKSFAESDGINHIFLVVRDSPKDKMNLDIEKLTAGGKISVISEANDDVLYKKLARALEV